MSKGLEALEYLRFCQIVNGIDCEGNIMLDYLFRVNEEKYNIIEKELKALEIIKKYSFVFVEKEELKSGKYGDIELLLDETDFENQKEYELLKEVLEDE